MAGFLDSCLVDQAAHILVEMNSSVAADAAWVGLDEVPEAAFAVAAAFVLVVEHGEQESPFVAP